MVNIDYNAGDKNYVCARITLDNKYEVVLADDKFVSTVNNRISGKFIDVVYEDDKHLFRNLFDDECDVAFPIRIYRDNGELRWYVIFVVERNKIGTATVYVDLEFRDLATMNERFSYMDDNMNKYRNFLSLYQGRFFEYDVTTNIFKIYSYVNNRVDMYELDTLDEWKRRLIRLGQVDGENLDALEKLCNSIKDGVDVFELQIKTSVFHRGERSEQAVFRGHTIVRGNKRSLVVGVINTYDDKTMKKRDYYSAVDSTKDSATGVFNKKAITEFTMNRVKTFNMERPDAVAYFIICDIDNFKAVNDTYGHMFGDEVILTFTKNLKKLVDHWGTVGRIGGDEFFVLLENVTELQTLRRILHDVRELTQEELKRIKPTYKFTCSIGVSQYGKDGTEYERLFKIADKALYIAKEKGKDRFIIYVKEMHGEFVDDEKSTISDEFNVIGSFERMQIVNDTYNMLRKGGKEVISDILDKLIKELSIDGINVYYGNDKRRIYSEGVNKFIYNDASYVDENDYMNLFDEHGINYVSDITKCQDDYVEVYDIYLKSQISAILQIMIKDKDGNFQCMFSFNVYGHRRRKWSDEDMNMLWLICNAVVSYL